MKPLFTEKQDSSCRGVLYGLDKSRGLQDD